MRSSNPPPAATKPVAPAVETMGLARRFGPVQALAGISLTIRRGEFFSLLGPSGCGKTTLLRLIAGLDLPDAGSLKIGGVDTREIPAHQRPVNTVFQSYALFPHLNVRDNVAFGLRMKRVPAGQIAERVERVLALMQIPDLAERRPAQLSGGQQQRVALARALVNEPEVLLLDEPLGALDLKLRKQLQAELHQLQRRLGITFIYVTHDQDEALVMSDRIAVMNAGRIEQLGPAQMIYERPRTRFVAGFLGSCNLIEGRVAIAGADGWDCETALGRLRVRPGDRGEEGAAKAEIQNPKSDENPGRCALPNRQHSNRITLAIRPEKLRFLRKDELPPGNCVAARIEDRIYSGSETQYRLRAGEIPLKAVALNTGPGLPGFAVGSEVLCHLPETALIPLDD